MSKTRYPHTNKENAIKPLVTQVEKLSGTLENWLKCREDRMKSQAKLLQVCRTEKDISRFKAMGLLDFEGTSI